jgi:hypothetical protein
MTKQNLSCSSSATTFVKTPLVNGQIRKDRQVFLDLFEGGIAELARPVAIILRSDSAGMSLERIDGMHLRRFAKNLLSNRGDKVATATAMDADLGNTCGVAGEVSHVTDGLVQNIEPVVIQERPFVGNNFIRELFEAADFPYPNFFPITSTIICGQ